MLVSSIVVIGLESYLTTKGAGHSHSHNHEFWDEDSDDQAELVSRQNRSNSVGERRRGGRPSDIALDDMEASQGLVAGVSPLPTSSSNSSNQQNGKAREGDFDDGDSDLDLDMDELDPAPGNSSRASPYASLKPGNTERQGLPLHSHSHTGEVDQHRQLLQCLLLEAGILFHSIFIGMAISVSTGPAFIIFLIAISFHQCFEGIALGGRIAAIQFPKRSIRPWLMVLAFGLTTPLGQAIGLAVHEMYDPQSMGGLLVVGIMNAISSGLLIYAAFVQLLYEDFLSEDSYKVLRGKKRLHAYLAIAAGSFLMAAVGAFA